MKIILKDKEEGTMVSLKCEPTIDDVFDKFIEALSMWTFDDTQILRQLEKHYNEFKENYG